MERGTSRDKRSAAYVFAWPEVPVLDVGEYHDVDAGKFILYVLVPAVDGGHLEFTQAVPETAFRSLNRRLCSEAKEVLLAEAQAAYAEQRRIALTVRALEGEQKPSPDEWFARHDVSFPAASSTFTSLIDPRLRQVYRQSHK